MADAEPITNITPLRPADPTNAERQRRHRAKKRKRTVTRRTGPTVTTAVTPSRNIATVTLVAALALATSSAAFSISGLTSIFAGAFWAVIGLGVAFEIGKLSAVAWLGNRAAAATLRFAMTALVAVLMVLNSIGVYGFLSHAHIEHALAGDMTVASKVATVDARLDAKQADLDDIKGRIAQLDQTKTIATKGHTRTTTIGDQGPARAALTQERVQAETALADLRIEKAKVDGERKAVEADLARPGALPRDPARLNRRSHDALLHPDRGAFARPRRRPVAPGRDAGPIMKEPRVNLDRLVSQVVLDCSLLRWFAFNRRRDDVLAAIALQRTRAKDTEGQVLDFLVRHCGGQQ